MTKHYQKISFWIINLILIMVLCVIVGLIFLASGSDFFAFLKVIFIEPLSNIAFFSGLVNVFALVLLLGLAAGICFKYKIYNFGIPGQMMASTIVTYIVACSLASAGITSRATVILLVLITILVGYMVGLLTALLKVYFKTNEIISTVLLNFIIWKGYEGLISSEKYHSLTIPDFASLRFSLDTGPLSPSNLFSSGIIIAAIVLILVILVFNNRTFGFKIMATAQNPIGARQARINPKSQYLLVLPISGAIAGLAGYLYFMSLNRHLPQLTFLPQEGFYAISVAALAFFEPSLMFFSAIFIALFLRPIELNSFAYLKNPNMILIILGIIIYFLGIFPFMWKLYEDSEWIYDQKTKIKKYWFKLRKKKYDDQIIVEERKQSSVSIVKVEAAESQTFWKSKRFSNRFKKTKKTEALKEGEINEL